MASRSRRRCGRCWLLCLSCKVSILLLLLLRSPARSLGFTVLGEMFVYVVVFCLFVWLVLLLLFFNPTVEAVTFRLHGCCILGVFLLPAFTRLGHECQDLSSPCDGMHVCTDYASVYTLTRKSFRGMGSEPMLTPREKSPLPEKITSEELPGQHSVWIIASL